MSPRIRALLGFALLLLLAGCSAPGSVSLTAVDDAVLADEASRSLPSPEADEERALVLGVVENGSATANGTRPPVETEGYPFAVDGAYYDLSAEVVDSRIDARVSLEIDYNGTTDGRVVAYDDLSPADRALVDALLPPRSDRRVEGYDMGAGGRYTQSEAASSVLLSGEYAAIRYEGERYPIRVERRDVTVRTYRYTASQVASSDEAYADRLRDRHQFTLSGLSDAERGVIEEATGDTYHAETDDDEAFRSVLDRFRSHDAVRSDEYGGEWVVRYRGTVYWAELHYDGFPE